MESRDRSPSNFGRPLGVWSARNAGLRLSGSGKVLTLRGQGLGHFSRFFDLNLGDSSIGHIYNSKLVIAMLDNLPPPRHSLKLSQHKPPKGFVLGGFRNG